MAASPTDPGARRAGIALVLLIVCWIVTPFAVVAGWAHSTALDTDTYVDATDSIFEDEALIDVATERLTDLVIESADISGIVDGVIPGSVFDGIADGAEDLARGPLEGAIRTVLEQQLLADGLQWLNREAHEAIVPILRGENQWVRIDGDELVVDLDPALEAVQQRVEEWGVSVWSDGIPDGTAEFVVTESEKLGDAQSAVDTLDLLEWLLPFVAAGSAVAAIVIAPGRVNAVRQLAGGVAVTTALVLIVNAIFSFTLLWWITDPIAELAGQNLWDVAGADLARRLLSVVAASAAVWFLVAFGQRGRASVAR